VKRAVRKLIAPSICLVPLALAAPALADEPCPPVDLTCVVGDAVDRGGDVVDDVTDPVADVTDPVVRPILDRVDDVVKGSEPTDPPGGHGSGRGGGVGGGDRSGTGAERPRQGAGTTDHGGQAVQGTHPRVVRELRTTPTSSVVRPLADPRPSAEGDTLSRAAAAVARSLLVVGVLFGITLGFLLVQQRLDRNDPKVVEAPLEPETVTFA
jgi:hypothetical protein